MDICRTEDPPAFALPDGGRVHCHLHTDGPRLAGASKVSGTVRGTLGAAWKLCSCALRYAAWSAPPLAPSEASA